MNKLKRKTLKMPVRYLMNTVLVVLLFVLLSFMTQNVLSTYQNKVLLTVGINIILAVSLNVSTGYLGQLPLGHAGFMAVGAYTCALFTKYSPLPSGVAFVIGLALGAVMAGIFGVLIGIPALRLTGDYLAILTLGVGEHIRITVDAAGAGQFFIDPDKLARALGNVLRNAVAYADANSVIAIAARQDARTTTITVANRGREISDAHLETIFEKFYREDGARSSKKGGAGLGLAIAREIVVAHHGDIEAASERGVTVFTLRIPTQGEEIEGAAAAPRQGTSPLNPRNARHGQVPARKTVRDNDATPRRRGLSR